ncbi:MAG: endopeptidase La [Spirochaetales bacterium]|jgi:ATP-dependent Lon protease|nr:endopeptidase La [Spirochaetales bacterium]
MKLFDKALGRAPSPDMPLIPLRDIIVFPGMVAPVFTSRGSTLTAISAAMDTDRRVFLAGQKNIVQEPGEEDLYAAGCVGHILQLMKLPDQSVRVLIEGKYRAVISTCTRRGEYFRVEAREIFCSEELSPMILSLMRIIEENFKTYAALNKRIPADVTAGVERTTHTPNRLVDIVCAHVPLKINKKAELLAAENTENRLRVLAETLMAENEILELQQKISSQVKKRMEKNQKDFFLHEQIKEINKELGQEPEDPTGVNDLEAKIREKNLPLEAHEKIMKELRRLEKLQVFSPEAGILRTYAEWFIDLPWNEKTADNRDIEAASRILDEDHYGLEKPKDRILDFIAVRQLKEKVKGPILCLVGPPGTGKTSLARSLARCLGRNFVRMSLGGVRDEAEIRGHRKTYVGALPGKILQSMRKSASRNPVFLLDEIDKMSSDFRGDPASALLEVLDPQQNSTFMDHYLEVPYDLSDVMFITTANCLHNIPYALRDRMEVIEVPGYTEYEKLKIAEGFLLPRQIAENGLDWAAINFKSSAVREIIHSHTMESGVRGLERKIAHVIRKIAREAVRKGRIPRPPPPSGGELPLTVQSAAQSPEAEAAKPEPALQTAAAQPQTVRPGGEAAVESEASYTAPPEGVQEFGAENESAGEQPQTRAAPEAPARPFSVTISAKSVRRYLGNPRFKRNKFFTESWAGLACGLAWTELGGALLPVEAVVFEGSAGLILTGHLGDVMKESALTAFSYIRSRADGFKLSPDFSRGKDIHIHVPEGAIPKDGPSAGITLTAAVLSALSGVTVNPGFAMTGEITLAGRVLPVGGIKEKVLAAHRNGIARILLPGENADDLDELPREVVSSTEFFFAGTILEALKILFPKELFRNDPG